MRRSGHSVMGSNGETGRLILFGDPSDPMSRASSRVPPVAPLS
jgi:hypothetical protein